MFPFVDVTSRIFASIFLFYFAVIICLRYLEFIPDITEASVESNSVGAIAPLPDIAITLNTNNHTPASVLNYVWPEFSWVQTKNGFTNLMQFRELMDEVQYGAKACDLNVGYIPRADGLDEGRTTWPVFCIRGSQHLLGGRFGDANWSHLQVKINKCNYSSPDPLCVESCRLAHPCLDPGQPPPACEDLESCLRGCRLGLAEPLREIWSGVCADTPGAILTGGLLGVNVWSRRALALAIIFLR